MLFRPFLFEYYVTVHIEHITKRFGLARHYENTPIRIYWKFYHQKWKKKIQIKNFCILHISDQNIDCGYSLEPPRRGGSNEYPQSMLLSRNKKNNVYPCKPQFYYIKLGFKGVKIVEACFRDDTAFITRLHVRPAKTQISPRGSGWSESSLSTWRRSGSLAALQRPRLNCVDAQAELSLRWAHI